MKKYIIPFICLFGGLVFISFLSIKPDSHINDYPNLPAPIAKENILLTNVGQAVEGEILKQIVNDLNLDGDYRPRALASDLYDYQSLVISIGYSPTGLANTPRSFEEEKQRLRDLTKEAELQGIPVVVLHLSNDYKGDARTWELIHQAIPKANYFIGIESVVDRANQTELFQSNSIPYTLVNNLEEIRTPLNSAFR
ncbi:DUF6305 family protein [Aquibacillus sediminis]|uniref:DUF6305 family protein n=1 Tax=Aquibacillus sediminis TaxID=2574734 RepID=UPI001108408B|nr:DUF6305 family protein [Aquibacillus sediminis]